MVGISADVMLRTFGGSSVPGVLEIVELILAAAVFLGLAEAQHQGGHIRVQLVTERLSARRARQVRLFALAVSGSVCAVMIYVTASSAMKAYVTGEARWGLLSVETWPGRFAVCLGLLVLFAEFIISFVRLLMGDSAAEEDIDVSSSI
jgi:TRAP-type C4-dicarboxylate transport system permease small subunit